VIGERRPPGRAPFGSVLPMGAVAALTTVLALTSWRGFLMHPGTYLRPLLVLAALLALSGALLRWLGTPRWLTAVGQATLATVVVTREITGGLVPVGATGAEVWQALEASVRSARHYAAPLSDQVPPVWPLLVVAGAVVLVLVDVLACTLHRVPAAGLCLLAVYALPSGVLDGGPDVWSFVGAAAGFLVLLHLDSRELLLRWGRAVGPAEDTLWRHSNPIAEALRAGAARIGVAATALALVVPAFLPVAGVELLDLGAGGGSGDIRIHKPVADMRRDLERGRDVPLLRVRTDDPTPSYLRISVLNRYTGEEWSSGDRDVASDDTADGAVPPPPGLSDDVPRTEHRYRVSIGDDFASSWLPTQFPVSAVDAEGDWRFDPTTMDFLAADDDLDTRGIAYTMTAVDLRFGSDRSHFRNARTGDVPDELLELPSTVPPQVRTLAREVTAGATSDYERALLLQRFFRQDGGFTYDLEKAPEGAGDQTLASFLSPDGRVGYCEQFASAMAVMARVLQIPARVAVGFLEPAPVGPDEWEFSSHDLHAWPELYFEGSGWVRFEPTPAGRVPAEDLPAYTRVPVAAGGQGPDALPADPSAAAPGGAATSAPSPGANQRPAIDNQVDATGADGDDGGVAPLLLAAVAAGVLLLVGSVVIGGPVALRARRRRARLAGSPDDVWAEVRDTAVDLGLPWPAGRSPREVGGALVDRLAPVDGAADALERLVLAVERSRYARPGTVATLERTDLDADGALVVAALEAAVGRRAHRRARWLPRSVWRR